MTTKLMIDRFLSWPLPESLCSDHCASMPGYPHRTGTNLMTAEQAKEMLDYVLAAPAPVQAEPASPWVAVSERMPSAGQLVIASGFIFGKLENGCWVEPAIYEEDDREFHPPKPNEEGDLVADFDATMNHTTHWMPLPPAPEVV